jgi:MoxR-like ATPase
VTADGTTRPVPDPFLLIATENPIEQEGTFPLPEAQLDRFFVKTALGYPGEDVEIRILEEQVSRHPLSALRPVLTLPEADALREAAARVYVDPLLRRWIVQLVRATRTLDGVEVGASVRGSLALEHVARAWALLEGRDYATPADVERLFVPVVVHRIVFTPAFLAEAREASWDETTASLAARCAERAPRPGDDLDERVAAAALR